MIGGGEEGGTSSVDLTRGYLIIARPVAQGPGGDDMKWIGQEFGETV